MIKVISDHSSFDINHEIERLQKTNTVEVLSMSTCPAPEKYNRYDVQITVCLDVRPFPEFMNKD